MFCPKCGSEIKPGDKFCKNCGTLIKNNETYGYSNHYNEVPDEDNGWLSALSFFIPIFGIVMYFVERNERPLTAKNCLKYAVINIIVWVAIILVLVIASIVVASTTC